VDCVVKARTREEREAFSRMRIAEGGRLSRYCPLDAEAELEYQRRRTTRS
jgi:hypothetical protein